MEIALRCRQCGWQEMIADDRMPPLGVRLRCARCGALLPLLTPSASESAARDARSTGEGEALGESEADEARKIVRRWLEEIRRSDPAPLSEVRLYREHGEELARVVSLWQASHPGDESARVFRAVLLAALADLPSGAPSSDEDGSPPVSS